MSTTDPSAPPEATSHFTGEEGGDERSTPRKDLGAAVVIGALAIAAMVLSVRLEVPTSIYTAPGLFPFLTGLSLLAMAIGLGAGALRRGGAQNFFAATIAAARTYLARQDSQRTLLLMAVMTAYVLICGAVSFDLRLPTSFFVFQFSSWEAVSIPILVGVLRFFWRGPWWKCALYGALMVFALAAIFRYAFHILLPAAS